MRSSLSDVGWPKLWFGMTAIASKEKRAIDNGLFMSPTSRQSFMTVRAVLGGFKLRRPHGSSARPVFRSAPRRDEQCRGFPRDIRRMPHAARVHRVLTDPERDLVRPVRQLLDQHDL